MEDISSEFGGTETKAMIDANHMEMCRYSSREADGYRKVSGELRIFCKEIEESLKKEDASEHQQR